MFFQRIKTPGIAHNAYLLGSEGIGILIDPRRDVDEYIELARKNKLQIKYVLETHRQEDFVLGSDSIRRLTGAKIVSGKHAYFAHSDIQLQDDEQIIVGHLAFRCLYTPGHTPESVSYAVYMDDKPETTWAVFTGDALFIGEAGRTDLPDPNKTAENAALLFDCIHKKILPLGDQTLLYPAHGSGSVCGGDIAEYDESTLGFERTYNPVFICSQENFIQNKLDERIPRPPYFSLMEKLNLKGGIALPKQASAVIPLQPKDFEQKSKKGIVIDTRQPEAFAGGHIPGSYSIWLEGLPVFGGWVADDKTPVFLVLERPDDLAKAFLHLTRIGVDNICGCLAGGFEKWRDAGKPIQMSGTLEARSKSMASNKITLLDVREITEYEEGHLSGAKHAYVGFIPEIKNLSRLIHPEKPIAIMCSVGHRASLAVSMLLRLGFKHVSNLLGGITAWEKLKKPLTRGPDKKRTLDYKIIQKRASKESVSQATQVKRVSGILIFFILLFSKAAEAATNTATLDGAAWSPYIVGALIGLLVCLTMYFSDRPVGASSAYATLAGLLGKTIAPAHTQKLDYYQENPPKISWELFFVLSIVVGSFLAAFTGGEFSLRGTPLFWIAHYGTDHQGKYILISFVGGLLMAFGSRMAGGCTSGHGISGTSQLGVSSWIAVLCFFIGGVLAIRLIY